MPAPAARTRRTYMRRRALFEGPSSPDDRRAPARARRAARRPRTARARARTSASSARKASESAAGQRRLEELGEPLGALGVHVVAEQHAAHLLAHGVDRIACARRPAARRPRRDRARRGARRRSARNSGSSGSGSSASASRARPCVPASASARARSRGARRPPRPARPARAHLRHDAGDRRVEADLHLHRLEAARGAARPSTRVARLRRRSPPPSPARPRAPGPRSAQPKR